MLITNRFSLKTANNFNSARRRRLGCTTFLTIKSTTPLITTSRDSPLTSHLKIIAYSMMTTWNLH